MDQTSSKKVKTILTIQTFKWRYEDLKYSTMKNTMHIMKNTMKIFKWRYIHTVLKVSKHA